jgi:diguanylate cyclase (GGDEF)-like protein/hemerythrin-like metal-binding protein
MLNSSLAYAQVLVAIALAGLAILQAAGRKEKPQQFFALAFIALAFIALAASFILFILQNDSPKWLGVIVSNMLIVNAHLFLSFSFRFSDRHPRAWPFRFWVYEGFTFVLLLVFTYAVPLYAARSMGLSFIIAIALAECMQVLLRGYIGIPTRIRYPAAAVFAIFILCHLVRIGLFFAIPENHLMGDNPVTTFTFSFTIFFSIVCAGLFLLLDSSSLIERLNANNASLEALALKDELTGVLNRHSLDQTVAAEMERQDRYQTPLSLIMFDLDHFKRINDLFGHDRGDLVLAVATSRVGKSIRENDLLFRWGGEEFFILLPNTNLAGAIALAEKLRVTLSETEIPPVGTVSASFGVAERLPKEPKDVWFKRVDQAMYRAKFSGRNRVEAWTAGRPFREAMVRIEWQEDWNSGVGVIDREHRELIAKGNTLLNMAISGTPAERMKPLLDAIIEDIRQHFSDEEKILETTDYHELPEHREIHKALVADALIVQDNFEHGFVDASLLFHLLVDRIIVEHMLSTDIKFYPYLKRD